MDFTSETGLISHVIDELYTMGKFDTFGKDGVAEFRNVKELFLRFLTCHPVSLNRLFQYSKGTVGFGPPY